MVSAILIAGSALFGTTVIGGAIHLSSRQQQETMESMEHELKGALDDNAERIEGSMDAAITRHVDQLEASQAELNEIGNQFEDVFDEMDEAVSSFSAAVSTVEDFEGLRQWGETLEQAAEPVEEIASNVDTWRKEQQQLLDETTDVLSEWVAQRRRVEEVYEESMEGLEEWQTEHTITQQENAEALKTRLEQLSEHSEAMRRTVGELDEVIERESETRELLATSIPETLAGLEEVTEDVSDLTQRQSETIGTLEGIAEPMNDAAENFGQQSSKVLDSIREQAERNQDIQEDAASTITESNRQLRESVEKLQGSVEELDASRPPQIVEYAKLVLLAGILVGVAATAVL